jgi:transcriptional regulator with XRE-family HTH domain
VSKNVRSRVVRQIGRQVRSLRLDLGWTHEKLAEEAKMNPKYLGRLELGQSEPGAEILFRLARALSVPVSALVDRMSAGLPRPLPSRAPRRARR